ncbi:MAG: hypothetical protein LUD68_01325 [Rikenellaceae bacterium]|nr:hypothetical protein [Rikenellaceae bacterium]
MFDQFEKTRRLTLISPTAQYDYINEAILGGGYLRFRKNWDDLHTFQEQFLQWFKDLDARDEDSPHWYNPWEDFSTSKKSVSLELVPRYQERNAPLGERISFIAGYLAVMACMIVLLLGLAFFFFIRYDVR